MKCLKMAINLPVLVFSILGVKRQDETSNEIIFSYKGIGIDKVFGFNLILGKRRTQNCLLNYFLSKIRAELNFKIIFGVKPKKKLIFFVKNCVYVFNFFTILYNNFNSFRPKIILKFSSSLTFSKNKIKILKFLF